MNEQELIAAMKIGDKYAFDQFINDYRDYIFTLSMRVIKKKELAEEITQDVFLKIYQNIETFKQASKLSTWIYSITYRTALNYLQQNPQQLQPLPEPKDQSDWTEHKNAWKQISALQDSQASEGLAEHVNIQHILWKGIDQLPYVQGVVITLYYLNQMKIKEITDVIDLPVNTVKTHLFRGRKELRRILLTQFETEDLI
ncbi:MAG: sigma-70 family RNA polymerase sigma factor [Caldithrix sp.]|nr:sigma-70 family RNA polymerase sigma factor [Caldithrix sp.]